MAVLSEVNGYGLAAAKPAGATEGYLYYETDTSLLKRYNGSSWDTMTTVITPTGAPAVPWWQNPQDVYWMCNAQQQGSAWTTMGGRSTPISISGTLDNEIGTQGASVLKTSGSVMYDTTPSITIPVGAYAGVGVYYPMKLFSDSINCDWYMATRIATHGLTDHSYLFYTAKAQPSKFSLIGEYVTWAATSGASIGFQAIDGDTNWTIFGSCNPGSVGYNITTKDSGVAFAAETEYLLEMAYSSTDNEVSFYINGSLVGTIDMATEYGPYHSSHYTTAELMHLYLGMSSTSTTPTTAANWEAAWLRCGLRKPDESGFLGSW